MRATLFRKKNRLLKLENYGIKFLETQIKFIQDSLQKKGVGTYNWLITKKPLKNYVCASCENFTRRGLDKISEFVHWINTKIEKKN